MSSTESPKAPRRLRFESPADMLADAERCLAASPRIAVSGNWTPGQIVEHVARTILASLDGYPDSVRSVDLPEIPRPLVERFLRRGLRPGLRLPTEFDEWLPDEDVDLADAVEQLRQVTHRLETERITVRQPYLGDLSHDEWIQFHLRHAELHFGHMHPLESEA